MTDCTKNSSFANHFHFEVTLNILGFVGLIDDTHSVTHSQLCSLPVWAQRCAVKAWKAAAPGSTACL